MRTPREIADDAGATDGSRAEAVIAAALAEARAEAEKERDAAWKNVVVKTTQAVTEAAVYLSQANEIIREIDDDTDGECANMDDTIRDLFEVVAFAREKTGTSCSIVVNGREHLTHSAAIYYEDVVKLSGLSPAADSTLTVTYRQKGESSSDNLYGNRYAEAAEGAVFNVVDTSNA